MSIERVGRGFTIVELLIVIVIIGILAAIGVISYQGIVKKTVQSALIQTIKQAATAVEMETIREGRIMSDLPLEVQSKPGDDITLRLVPIDGTRYGALSPVQNGVLFYNTCLALIGDPYYSTIHARTGGGTMSVMMSCDPGGTSVLASRMLISGWDSQPWDVPVTRQKIENYLEVVEYDDWWTDKQAVIRTFYTELASRFESQGGTWPITSFWDHWANEWAGVHKEDLPEPSSSSEDGYCILGVSKRYPDMPYSIKNTDGAPHEGDC